MNRFQVRANMKKEVAARSRPARTVVKKFPGRRRAKSKSLAEENEHSKLRANRRVQRNAAASARARRRLRRGKQRLMGSSASSLPALGRAAVCRSVPAPATGDG